MKGPDYKVIIAAVALTALAAGLRAGTPASGFQEKSAEDIIKKVASSVVKVEARNGVRKVATGVVIDSNGHIVTTALISPREEKISVITTDGRRIDAKFLGYDSETHLAVIEAKEKNLTAIAVAREDVSPGAWIGVVSMSPENKAAITQGIVNSIAENSLRLNVWVVQGASGSPVVNKQGQMVGLLRGVYFEELPMFFEFHETQVVGSGMAISRAEAPASGMALAVPSSVVVTVAEAIRDKGKVERGWLGVEMRENEDGRVEVVSVDKESPASLAKITKGDVILKIDGKDVVAGPMLAFEIQKRKPGQDVVLKIRRDGKDLEVKVKLGERPEEETRKELDSFFNRILPLEKSRDRQEFFPPVPNKVLPNKTPLVPRPSLKGFLTWGSRRFIGLYLEEMNRDLSDFFGVKDGVGLLVNAVEDKSAAQKAGLKVGDVIIRADGKRVERIDDLSEMIQDLKKGDKIKIEFLRSKKEMTVEVAVDEEDLSRKIPDPDSERNALRSLLEADRSMPDIMKDWGVVFGEQILGPSRKISFQK